ncbi:hypothetical protein ABT294_44935 [Nonomuraea sp. NPDC000554]|uniref:hypothetical protein n=1 Tax=Nonomuraea sp. NPDC000554 TaxID=3154259 RepID=UPI00331C342B
MPLGPAPGPPRPLTSWFLAAEFTTGTVTTHRPDQTFSGPAVALTDGGYPSWTSDEPLSKNVSARPRRTTRPAQWKDLWDAGSTGPHHTLERQGQAL